MWQTQIKSYNTEYLRNKIGIVKMRIDYNRLIYIVNLEQIGNTSKSTHQTISFFVSVFAEKLRKSVRLTEKMITLWGKISV